MKQKLLLLILTLCTSVGGAKAALSSSTIAKSGNVTDTWSITSALPTDNWTAMGDATPTGVTALGYTDAYYRTQDITLSNEGALFITFLYSSGQHQLEILGVDLLNSDNVVVRSDYHYGKTGTYLSHNAYMLDHITSGDYKIRFIINSGVSNSTGNITVKHINIKTASSFADINNWYFVRMHSNQTNYMYYDKSSTGIAFSSSKQNNAHYLWGFVKDTDGIRIYNKAAGSSVAIDNANPCTLSASGQTFTFGTGHAGNNGAASGAYFSLFVNPDRSATAKSYLNYRAGGTIQRWSGDDQGSAWMIDEATISAPFVEASQGKIYKIQAYFSDSDNLYFTNDGTNLAFNTSTPTSSGVNDYWILRSSGDGNYPWRFESGRGDGKFLSNNSASEGLTSTGVYLQINNIDSESYFNLRGSNSGDATTTGIVNLGTWTGGKSGFGKYGSGGCWSSSDNNDSGWSTKYIIEEVADVDIYTVVSNINAGGVNKTTYTGKAEQTNGGFYILASDPSASDFTAISVTDFTPGDITVNTTTKTITVNYSSTYAYTFTDVNGQEYTGTSTGEFGVTPTLTGCAGYTLSNEVWDEGENTYKADITFPFPISSNNVTNWTYITNFSANSSKFYWYTESASATRVVVEKGGTPTNGNNTSYEWAIIPSFSNGAFTFTIKNNSTNTYVTSTSSSNSHSGAVTLSSSGSSLSYIIDDNYHRWKLSTDKQLSINSSSDNTGIQELGTWGKHDGTAIGIEEAEDFATLLANLKTARNLFNQYLLYFSNGTYTETVEGTMTTTYNQQAEDRNVVKDSPTAYFTAAQFKTYTDNYNNAVDGLNYVMPTGKFIRIRNLAGTKYVKDLVANYNSDETLDYAEGGTDAASIFYVDASSKIIAYNSGLYLFAANNTPRITLQSYADTYEFLKGSAPLQVYVHSANNPSGWGGDNRYWSANESTSKVNRVAATSSASEFLIETIENLPVTITAAKYATLCVPVALEIPEGVKAYYISNVTTTEATLTKLTGTIPANMPVILYADEITETTTFDFPITTADAFVGTNKLSGQAAAQNVAAGVAYTLQTASNEDSTVGFYPKDAGTIAGFKAYLLAENVTAGVKGLTFLFDDDDADGITSVQALGSPEENVFDLSGRRVNKPTKGLYIVNGKKVMVK